MGLLINSKRRSTSYNICQQPKRALLAQSNKILNLLTPGNIQTTSERQRSPSEHPGNIEKLLAQGYRLATSEPHLLQRSPPTHPDNLDKLLALGYNVQMQSV